MINMLSCLRDNHPDSSHFVKGVLLRRRTVFVIEQLRRPVDGDLIDLVL